MLDAALFVGAISAIRLLIYHFASAYGNAEDSEPQSTLTGLLFAALALAGAAASHARHGGYYVMLAWIASSGFLKSAAPPSRAYAVGMVVAGIACILFFGDHPWMMLGTWIAGSVILGTAANVITGRLTSRRVPR